MKSTRKWEKIGVVGVDAGMLLICDPCYIDSDWQKNRRPVQSHYWKDKQGVCWAYAGWGKENLPEGIRFFEETFDKPLKEYGGKTPNELIAQQEWEEVQTPLLSSFDYAGCCSQPGPGGQLDFKKGHAGAGVVVSSGYGDGEYAVEVRRNKEGRVAELRVVFIE